MTAIAALAGWKKKMAEQETQLTRTGNVKLEGARQLVVLYRLEAKQVVKIRVASEDCTLVRVACRSFG